MNLNKIAKTAGGLATALLLLMSISTTPLQAAGTPVIGAGGIVNGAHFRAASMPGGDIAQGSIFSIFGVDMGPTVAVFTGGFPLDTNVGGVEITVTQGSVTVNAIPLVVSAGQINAIMPSNTPLGVVEVRVICNGVASEPESVTIVATSIGIFTPTSTGTGAGTITDHPNFMLNTSSNTAMPNDVMILWVTGVRGIAGADNVSPIDAGPLQDFKNDIGLQVTVGGRPVAEIFYAGRDAGNAGLDIISVRLSGDIPLGCNVPVVVTADGITSNSVTMATSADGGECSDEPDNPISNNLGAGKNGSIVVARIKASVDLGALGLLTPAPVKKALGLEKGFFPPFPPLGGTVETTLDVGAASFMELSEGDTIDPTILSNFINMPPYGVCTPFTTEGLDIIDMGTGGGAGRPLGAGSPVTLTRASPSATRTMLLQNGTAATILGEGGLQPLSLFLGISSPQLFLEAGSYTAAGPAGSEIGSWTVDFNLAAPVDFTNDGNFGTVNRGTSQRVEWSGGNDTQFVEVVFVNVTDVQAEEPTATGVVCLGRPSDGGLTVASSLLGTIPASTPPDANGDVTSIGVVLVGGTQFKDIATFTAQGLDSGVVTSASVNAVTTIFE